MIPRDRNGDYPFPALPRKRIVGVAPFVGCGVWSSNRRQGMNRVALTMNTCDLRERCRAGRLVAFS